MLIEMKDYDRLLALSSVKTRLRVVWPCFPNGSGKHNNFHFHGVILFSLDIDMSYVKTIALMIR